MKQYKKYYIYIYCLLLLFLVYLAMPKSMLISYPMGDATIFQYFGYAMSKGERLYIDLFDHKGPIIFLINYLGYSFGGESGIKIVYIICIFLFFISVYNISRLFSKKYIVHYSVLTIICIVFLTVFESGLGLEGYMLPFIAYSFYVYLDYFINNKYTNIRIICVGISFAIVFYTKINMVGCWFVLSIFALIHNISLKKFKEIANFVFQFLVGFIIVSIPLLLYFVLNQSLWEMIYQSLIVNFRYTGDSPYTGKQILLWIIKVLNQSSILFFMVVGSVIYYIKNKKIAIYSWVLMVFCISMVMISKREYLHYLIVLIPLFVPSISICIDKYVETLKNINLASVTIVLFILMLFFPQINDIKQQINDREINKTVNLNEVASYLKKSTSKNERIYAHRMYGSMYLLANRLSSTRYFFIPGFYDDSEFIGDFKKEFEKAIPKYIVIDRNRLYGSYIDQYIEKLLNDNYRIIKESENIVLYKKV